MDNITATEVQRRIDHLYQRQLPHPLMALEAYKHKGIDKRFGVHRYMTTNSALDEAIKGPELGTTGVRGTLYGNIRIMDETRYVYVIAWIRRHGVERIKEAIACAIMLGHETIVVAHAFGAE